MKNREKGFALVEATIALGIAAIIVPAVGMSVFQTMRITRHNNYYITAMRQIQNSGYWVARDAAMAQTIMNDDPATPETEFITMVWTNWATGNSYRIVYLLGDGPGSSRKLSRTETIKNADGLEISSSSTYVAGYLVPDPVFSEQNGIWVFELQSEFESESASAQYEIEPRVNM